MIQSDLYLVSLSLTDEQQEAVAMLGMSAAVYDDLIDDVSAEHEDDDY
jgi:hypothetical protein